MSPLRQWTKWGENAGNNNNFWRRTDDFGSRPLVFGESLGRRPIGRSVQGFVNASRLTGTRLTLNTTTAFKYSLDEKQRVAVMAEGCVLCATRHAFVTRTQAIVRAHVHDTRSAHKNIGTRTVRPPAIGHRKYTRGIAEYIVFSPWPIENPRKETNFWTRTFSL